MTEEETTAGSVGVATPGGVSRREAAGQRAFGALRVANFRFLLAGTMAASFAMWMNLVGQGWLVAKLTNSPFQLGLLQFIGGSTVLLVSPFAGGLSERFDRRLLSGMASSIIGVNALIIGLLIATGRIEIWHLYVIAVVGGLSSSIYAPVRQFMVYDAVGRAHLPNAIALNSMVSNMARVVGPGIAGFMLAFSVSSVFFGQFLFFAVATLTLIPMRLDRTAPPAHEPVLTAIVEGARYLKRHRTLLRLLLLQAIPALLVFPYLQLVALMAKNYLHVGSAGYGWLQTGVGVGAFVGSLAVAYFGNIPRKGLIGSGALLLYMAMIFAFSFSRDYFLSLACLISGGLGLVVFLTFNQTLLQLHLDDEYRGRVISLYTMSSGLTPFGSLFMGFVAERILGTPHTIAVFVAVALVLAFFSGLASKDIRRL